MQAGDGDFEHMFIYMIQQNVFGRPFVKRFALCYRTVVCPVLSVTFIHCGQTVGRIKMKLGMQVGLGPGHTVLDGDPAPPPPKGHWWLQSVPTLYNDSPLSLQNCQCATHKPKNGCHGNVHYNLKIGYVFIG